jgi:hypothetical protein
MVIDQRNAGASVTPTSSPTYTVDRWAAGLSVASKFSVQQNAGAVTPPAGFTNYLGVTSLSAYTVGAGESFSVQQRIEGYSIADLGWGTANAKTVTLSFWVRSSLTGTFGGVFRNGTSDRTYPYSYTISAANTWEQKTVTIAGDTTGTWSTTNGIGLSAVFSLGAGSSVSGTAGSWSSNNFANATGATQVVATNGATFYITGVQLEVGTQATSFEYRQYQQELALAQRYYEVLGGDSTSIFADTYSNGGNVPIYQANYRVTKRATPTMASFGTFSLGNTSGSVIFNPGVNSASAYYQAAATGRAFWLNNASSGFTLSAEL